MKAGEDVGVEADVRNTGERAGDEVVELYLTSPQTALSPIHALEGFTRVHLQPGETQHVRFTLHPRQLSVVDAEGKRSVSPGSIPYLLADDSPLLMLGFRRRFPFRAASRCRAEGTSMRLFRLLLVAALAAHGAITFAETGAAGWLWYAPVRDAKQYVSLPAAVVPLDHSPIIQSAANETARGLEQMLGHPVLAGDAFSTMPEFVIGTVTEVEARFPQWRPAARLKPEGYAIARVRDHGRTDWIVAGADARGALYGAFICFKRSRSIGLGLFATVSSAVEQVRWVDQWDNLDGSIERGYAGRSIFFDNGSVRPDLTRAGDYARLLASVGINGCAVNNVNADLRMLTPEMIGQVARIAD